MRVRELGYQPGLDTIRAAGIALVVSWHVFHWPRGGFLGVDVFFVLSGFLITTLLLEERARYGAVRLSLFYLRRALRLFPALWTFLLVSAAAFAISNAVFTGTHQNLRRLFNSAVIGVTYTMNFAEARHAPSHYFPHLWSLAVEEQFYLVWPVVLVLALRGTRSHTRAVVVTVGLTVLTAFARLFLLSSDWAFNNRFDSILVGCVAALVYKTAARSWMRPALTSVPVLAGALLAAGFVLVAEPNGSTLLISLCSMVLLVAAIADPGDAAWLARTRHVLTGRPLLHLGRISYALYLWHVAVIMVFLQASNRESLGTVWSKMFVIMVSLALAAASYYLVERSFLRRKWKLARTTTHDTALADQEPAGHSPGG